MLSAKELKRLEEIEKRIREIAEEEGLLTTDIDFQIVPAQRVMEGMAYHFPRNFSYWQHGRDYERVRTIYEHRGAGIPYEQVWNLKMPTAFLVETNPFALNALTMAHVYGHVDFFLGSKYLQHGRSVADIAAEGRDAEQRFARYQELYGIDEVERIMDAADALRWHQPLDLFVNEDIPERELRQNLIAHERAKMEAANADDLRDPPTKEEIQASEKRLRELANKTPPLPMYDILLYALRHSKKPLKPWMEDIISVMRNQARHLLPQAKTKMLNEGWATFWHLRIMRRLFQEGWLTQKEHEVFNYYHSAVVSPRRTDFNWYNLGLALYEEVEERWDKGRFGREYRECKDPYKKVNWDTGAGLGRKKIFEVRRNFTDRMGVAQFFTDDFIHANKVYLWGEEEDPQTGEIVTKIVEDRPEVIRELLKNALAGTMGTPPIQVVDGNYDSNGSVLLRHNFAAPVSVLLHLEINPPEWRDKTLEHYFTIYGKPVYLETFEMDEEKEQITLARFSYNGSQHDKTNISTLSFSQWES